ncbi:hypothetical protein E2C01_030096 [Portunus trituberculatus]|uniref:Uncharacterized protein n=1 Tax=Portunus trituberculatus TaxID=210409 RepID=A0A5B7EPL1_PORTR|nr:hypothetical protein [Portunus trituberculatus]
MSRSPVVFAQEDMATLSTLPPGGGSQDVAKWQKPKEVKRWGGQRQPLASRLPLASRCPQRSTPRTKLRTKAGIRMTAGDQLKMKSEIKVDHSNNTDDEAESTSAK